MKIEVYKKGPICVLDIGGSVTIGKAHLLREKSKELIESGEKMFVLDMLDVPWLDSCGIGETVACYARTRDAKGAVKLVLTGKSHHLFTLHELNKVFEIYPDVAEALASFASFHTRLGS